MTATFTTPADLSELLNTPLDQLKAYQRAEVLDEFQRLLHQEATVLDGHSHNLRDQEVFLVEMDTGQGGLKSDSWAIFLNGDFTGLYIRLVFWGAIGKFTDPYQWQWELLTITHQLDRLAIGKDYWPQDPDFQLRTPQDALLAKRIEISQAIVWLAFTGWRVRKREGFFVIDYFKADGNMPAEKQTITQDELLDRFRADKKLLRFFGIPSAEKKEGEQW